jgi:DNA-binding NarL/FixJ family response regulator
MGDQIRIVVADGHTLTRFGLLGLVSAQPGLTVVGETGLGAQAVDLVAGTEPDVIVLDTALPDADGLSIARELRDRYAGLGIVLLTSDCQDDVLFRALEIGVSAFVPKIAPAAEVIAAIRHAAVAACSFIASDLGPAIARRAAVRSSVRGSSGPASSPAVRTVVSPVLSPREAEVLEMLGRGLSVAAVGAALYVSHSTAKTYVARVYDKLGAANRAQALMTGLQLGLLTRETRSPSAQLSGWKAPTPIP